MDHFRASAQQQTVSIRALTIHKRAARHLACPVRTHVGRRPLSPTGFYTRGSWCRAAETSSDTTGAPTIEDRTTYRLIQVTLKKPMGLVLADNKTRTNVIVEEVVPGGNADKSGKVQAGDIISRCSATVLKDGREGKYEKEGYGQRLYTNWEKIMFNCEGEDFDTVMKALSSNTERWGIFDVTLELKRYLSPAVNTIE